MDLTNVTIKTEYKYTQDEDGYSLSTNKKVEYLILEIPLPGGKAIYEIPLEDGVKANIEAAAQLSIKK